MLQNIDTRINSKFEFEFYPKKHKFEKLYYYYHQSQFGILSVVSNEDSLIRFEIVKNSKENRYFDNKNFKTQNREYELSLKKLTDNLIYTNQYSKAYIEAFFECIEDSFKENIKDETTQNKQAINRAADHIKMAIMEQISQDHYNITQKNSKITNNNKLKIRLNGSELDLKVWQKLLEIPLGKTLSYQELADSILDARYTRAVANSVGRNKIFYLIPCHRIIRKNNQLGGYGWGIGLKKELLAFEKSNV